MTDVAKLPKRAQEWIKQLEDHVRRANTNAEYWRKRSLDAVAAERAEVLSSDPRILVVGERGMDEIPLPSDHVRFSILGRHIEVSVRESSEVNGVAVLQISAPHDRLIAQPHSSNVLLCWPEGRHR